MNGAKNKIISGDYLGYAFGSGFGGRVFIQRVFGEKIYLDKSTVESYEVVDSDKMKSGTSAMNRAAIGGLLFGGLGIIGGAMGAKNKNVITIALSFTNGKRSLAEVDQSFYKSLLKVLF